jgi:hypothetical protein
LEADALEFGTAMDVDQAMQGAHPKQMEARNASLSADDQELSNTLNRDQAQRGEHEKQKPYADLSRQLEDAMAQRKQQRVH